MLDDLDAMESDEFKELLMQELYAKIYPKMLEDFRHKTDCTICDAALTGNQGGPIASNGSEDAIQSPASLTIKATHEASDLAFEEAVKTAKEVASKIR